MQQDVEIYYYYCSLQLNLFLGKRMNLELKTRSPLPAVGRIADQIIRA